MTLKEKIQGLVGNHVAPYMYGSRFVPGETTIPYSGMYWDEREVEAAITTFMDGSWVTTGDAVYEFEGRFSERFRVRHSLMVNSGSSANLIMLAALKKHYGWKDNDQVIVSPVGFPTTISVICQNQLRPVFADIEWETLNFNLDEVEKKITHRTVAILLSPVLGNPPDMDRLVAMCYKYGLQLVLDNCDSLGTRWDGKYLGAYAVAFSNSFYPAHHISTGEGGMVCTNDARLHKRMKSMAWWGRDCTCVGVCNMLKDGACGHRFDKWLPEYDGVVDHKYVFTEMGYNVKPLDLQGAIGLVQLEKFTEIDAKRKYNKAVIDRIVTTAVKGVRGITACGCADVSWFGVPFICEDRETKQKLVQHLERNKIQTRNYFSGNILLHPGFSHLDDYRQYPEANKVLDVVFFLGCTPHYGDEVFDYIKQVICQF